MQYVPIAALFVLVACGTKDKDSPDCEAYARHASDLNDPAPGKRDANVEAERSSCESGRISPEKVVCVNRAATKQQLLECYGYGTRNAPPTQPPAPAVDAAPPPKGTARVTLTEVRRAGSFQPIAPEATRPADQKAWLEKIKAEIAACETNETYVPQQLAMLVTFSPSAPTFLIQRVPDELASCLKVVFFKNRQPASVGNGPVDFMIDLGK